MQLPLKWLELSPMHPMLLFMAPLGESCKILWDSLIRRPKEYLWLDTRESQEVVNNYIPFGAGPFSTATVILFLHNPRTHVIIFVFPFITAVELPQQVWSYRCIHHIFTLSDGAARMVNTLIISQVAQNILNLEVTFWWNISLTSHILRKLSCNSL